MQLMMGRLQGSLQTSSSALVNSGLLQNYKYVLGTKFHDFLTYQLFFEYKTKAKNEVPSIDNFCFRTQSLLQCYLKTQMAIRESNISSGHVTKGHITRDQALFIFLFSFFFCFFASLAREGKNNA